MSISALGWIVAAVALAGWIGAALRKDHCGMSQEEWLRRAGTLLEECSATRAEASRHLADARALLDRVEAIRNAPDPLDEALNSGDGVYRP